MAFAWAFVIFLLVSLPSIPRKEGGFAYYDKVGHFALFFIFGILLIGVSREREINIGVLFIMALVYGLVVEINQPWIVGRDFSLFDLTSNLLGSFSIFSKKVLDLKW